MAMTGGLGIRAAHRALEHVSGPESLIALGPRDLAALGFERETAKEFLSGPLEERVETEWERAGGIGAKILDLRDRGYPQLLLETCDPPLVLYVRSRNWDPGPPHLAIVGSRRASHYGTNCAERFASGLAERGIVVASGLARGIDTAAHRGALATGRTVAILGSGIDHIYPRENTRLAESIVENGAILSEFPLGTPPLPGHFPRRNRILAGMALGTIVVEAAARSGSLITARMALEANREVFAIPGPITSARSHGPHLLIRQGACLVTGPGDVIEELPERVRQELRPTEAAANESPAPGSISTTGERLRGLMSTSEGIPIDLLIVQLGVPVSEAYAALLELELQGMVCQLPGDRYLLKM